MDAVFLKLLNMSLSACWIALAVFVLRLILGKAPKYIRCILWALVGIRLVCPFSFTSVFSLIPSAEAISPTVIAPTAAAVQNSSPADVQIPGYSAAAPQFPAAGEAPQPAVSPAQTALTVLSLVWAVGCTVMLVYGAVSYLKLRRRTAASLELHDGIWLCDDIDSPFILGIIRPRILVPSDMDSEQLSFVEAHERAHLSRRDHWWKPLGFALLALHWFNPAVWLAYVLFCRDIELACDEKVIRTMSIGDKREYSRALLSCSISHRSIAACPLAFGETGVKERIRSVLSYKKPAFWIIVASALVCVAVCLCFLTDPTSSIVDSELEAYLHTVILEEGRSDHTGSNFACEAHDIIGAEKHGDVITVYALVMYNEYSLQNGEIVNVTGWHIPSVITIDTGGYALSSNYRIPGDGTRYVPDIREMFPWHLESKAINIHRTAPKHEEQCRTQAENYYRMTGVGDMNIGAEMPSIVYGDGKLFIMSGTFGLIVYDAEFRALCWRMSHEQLQEEGIGPLCQFAASADGSRIYAGTFDGSDVHWDHVFDVEYYPTINSAPYQLTLSRHDGKLPGELHDHRSLYDGYIDRIDGWTMSHFLLGGDVTDTGDCFWYLRADTNWNMHSLQLVQQVHSTGHITVHSLFRAPDTGAPGLCSFIGSDKPLELLAGITRDRLVAAWGEPAFSYSKAHEDVWLIEDTGYVLDVLFYEDSLLVMDAAVNPVSDSPFLQDQTAKTTTPGGQ